LTMLVLGRKEQERILIGDDVVVTIVRLKGNRVQVGIEAPKSTIVVRAEMENKKGTKQ
jgi:carbon storage regulator